ncbi:alpha/beta fold hydrolase [Pseudomonas typographi]|uniref:alpha/beta fold hydrolase n=1 Tax=Pseudomonas typographi TaxID=2715964 RepID=UPI001682FBEE|nr:thioesterase [Pseudomonas typographi]
MSVAPDRIRLFCFACSGASAMVFAPWRAALPAWLDVQPVELPGHGRRGDEPLQVDMPSLAASLAYELAPLIDGPYLMLGHSVGAVVALEVAHALVALGIEPPSALIAVASTAPSRRDGKPDAQPMSDAELIAQMRRLDGTPQAVLDDPELLAMVLPVLRADFLLGDRYQPPCRGPLPCALHVFGGREDSVAVSALAAWEAECSGPFQLEMCAGGHFFLHRQRADFLRSLGALAQAQRPSLRSLRAQG